MGFWIKAALGAAGLGAAAAYTRLNAALKERLERFASGATGTAVSLRRVSIVPWSGEGRLEGLSIANPAGFSADAALRVDSIRVRLEPRSLLSQAVRVREVVVDSPQLTWELDAGGGNLGKLRERLGGPRGKRRQKARPASGGRRLIIESLVVRNGRLRVAASGIGGPLLLPLPELRLKDLGKESGGATAQEAISAALDALIRSGLEAAGGAGQTLSAAQKAVSKALRGLFGR
ncbi:MAG: hypothetical protein HY554_14305 [Elusimicrobia bacterium]|nr:hypothetical protein [Elusimicrobiota bacterium]